MRNFALLAVGEPTLTYHDDCYVSVVTWRYKHLNFNGFMQKFCNFEKSRAVNSYRDLIYSNMQNSPAEVHITNDPFVSTFRSDIDSLYRLKNFPTFKKSGKYWGCEPVRFKNTCA